MRSRSTSTCIGALACSCSGRLSKASSAGRTESRSWSFPAWEACRTFAATLPTAFETSLPRSRRLNTATPSTSCSRVPCSSTPDASDANPREVFGFSALKRWRLDAGGGLLLHTRESMLLGMDVAYGDGLTVFFTTAPIEFFHNRERQL